MVITPAIIWFSVKLEANIPKEIYAIAKSKNPNIVTNAVTNCGCPKYSKIPKYKKVNSSVIRTIITAEINLPSTILVILLGDVINNCSVPYFLSSANIRMVKIGTTNVKIVETE